MASANIIQLATAPANIIQLLITLANIIYLLTVSAHIIYLAYPPDRIGRMLDHILPESPDFSLNYSDFYLFFHLVPNNVG